MLFRKYVQILFYFYLLFTLQYYIFLLQNDSSNERKDETDMAIGGSLNVMLIREKLKEKKQQQLRELRAIQEEIKEGKLFPPPSANTSSFSTSPSASNQQPPPNTKLHTSPSSPLFTSPPSFFEQNSGALSSWPPVKMHCLLPPLPSSSYCHNLHPSSPWRVPQRERADTPEILLVPRCLPHHYSHWSPPGHLSHRYGEKLPDFLSLSVRSEQINQ